MPDAVSMPAFRRFPFGSEDYQAAWQLREAVLRQPLGLSLGDENLADEAAQWHFGLFENGTIVACVIAKPLSPERVKLRQMAVAPATQGRGLGAQLLQLVEQSLRTEGITQVEMSARAAAVPFYERQNYRCEGTPFIEVTLPHWRMEKSLR